MALLPGVAAGASAGVAIIGPVPVPASDWRAGADAAARRAAISPGSSVASAGPPRGLASYALAAAAGFAWASARRRWRGCGGSPLWAPRVAVGAAAVPNAVAAAAPADVVLVAAGGDTAAGGTTGLASRRAALGAAAAAVAAAAASQGCWAEGVGKEDEVVAVVDGDTVKLAGIGRCRLIGVNTPETVSPKQLTGKAPPDCFGTEASKFTKALLPAGTKVRVELDAGPTDRYGRNLVYLYRAQDNMFVNAELVKQGLARRMRISPNVRYDELFVKLEKQAQASGTGLWKACPVGSAAAAPAPSASTAGAPAGAGLGPGDIKNCKDFQTYEEAKAWFDSYFPLYGDVAKLDGDGDGKPCEKLLRKPKVAA